MSAVGGISHTPRADLRDGDRVKLTGSEWHSAGMGGEILTVVGEGFEASVFHDSEPEMAWYIMDPVTYRAGVIDWSVTLVDESSE